MLSYIILELKVYFNHKFSSLHFTILHRISMPLFREQVKTFEWIPFFYHHQKNKQAFASNTNNQIP